MDSQAFSKLDPKLQETYRRVMGTQTTEQDAAIPEVDTQPRRPSSFSTHSPITTPLKGFNKHTARVLPGVVNGKSKNADTPSKIPVIYIIGGVLFFVVYTFVWISAFKMKFF